MLLYKTLLLKYEKALLLNYVTALLLNSAIAKVWKSFIAIYIKDKQKKRTGGLKIPRQG